MDAPVDSAAYFFDGDREFDETPPSGATVVDVGVGGSTGVRRGDDEEEEEEEEEEGDEESRC